MANLDQRTVLDKLRAAAAAAAQARLAARQTATEVAQAREGSPLPAVPAVAPAGLPQPPEQAPPAQIPGQ